MNNKLTLVKFFDRIQNFGKKNKQIKKKENATVYITLQRYYEKKNIHVYFENSKNCCHKT